MRRKCHLSSKKIEERYELINEVYNGFKGISQTARTLQISDNTVRKANDWIKSGRPQLNRAGRPENVDAPIKYFIFVSTVNQPDLLSSNLIYQIKL